MYSVQNKTANTIFYSIVIVVAITLGYGNLCRYKSDVYLDLARQAVPYYALKNERKEEMQWAYREAVQLNPLESQNYSNILNKTYLQLVQIKQ